MVEDTRNSMEKMILKPSIYALFALSISILLGFVVTLMRNILSRSKTGANHCAKRVELDIVGHITSQHGSFYKVQRKKRLHKGGYNAAYSAIRKELSQATDEPIEGQASSMIEEGFAKKSSDKVILERTAQQPPASGKDQEEKARKSEFVQGLIVAVHYSQ